MNADILIRARKVFVEDNIVEVTLIVKYIFIFLGISMHFSLSNINLTHFFIFYFVSVLWNLSTLHFQGSEQ